ncbi:MAG: PKD domain-containing protein [Thermoplasmatales archaeon]|nr:MAG: PKD domain-containing protein [Thermoplasmatales archaeon]
MRIKFWLTTGIILSILVFLISACIILSTAHFFTDTSDDTFTQNKIIFSPSTLTTINHIDHDTGKLYYLWDDNKVVTAHFTQDQYILTVSIVGNGSVNLNPPGGSYPSGTVVTLTASPDPGWTFSHWSGDLSGSSNPETIIMDGNKSVTTHFMYPSFLDIIVYTAQQGYNSRIYLLRMDGTEITNYEYSNLNFLDLEVINKEVYVVETFTSAVYNIDLETGNLETIIQDFDLEYIYGLTFDGTYFYIAESELNRYDINGNKQGNASFDEVVLGAAWDGVFYWTLNDNNQIKCWDISNWPTITQGPYDIIVPPSTSCRGLWFDQQYFWTAENINITHGNIYRFNYNGEIISQWVEPTYKGWSACMITDFYQNNPPHIPEIPLGPISGSTGIEYNFTTSTIDPEGDEVYYKWDWGNGLISDWMGPYESGVSIKINYTWTQWGTYEIKVKSKDTYDSESNWSEPLIVNITEIRINILIGRISNFNASAYICTFNADKLIWLSFPPPGIKYYSSGEKLKIRSDYIGLVREHFIICIVNN